MNYWCWGTELQRWRLFLLHYCSPTGPQALPESWAPLRPGYDRTKKLVFTMWCDLSIKTVYSCSAHLMEEWKTVYHRGMISFKYGYNGAHFQTVVHMVVHMENEMVGLNFGFRKLHPQFWHQSRGWGFHKLLNHPISSTVEVRDSPATLQRNLISATFGVSFFRSLPKIHDGRWRLEHVVDRLVDWSFSRQSTMLLMPHHFIFR